MKILLDTNICIYLIKNKPPDVGGRLKVFAPGEVGLSAITAAELNYGVAKSQAVEQNARALEAFLLPLEVLDFDAKSALAYGRLRAGLERKGQPVGGLDLLIAAQAVAHDLLLITHNLKEFKRVPGLRCETWLKGLSP
jgi:tRNA(fMet)-specific endonuclease VapC